MPSVRRIPTSRLISASRFASERVECPDVRYCDAAPADDLPEERRLEEVVPEVPFPEELLAYELFPEDLPDEAEAPDAFSFPVAEVFRALLFVETPDAVSCLPLLCANDYTPLIRLSQCRYAMMDSTPAARQ